LIQALLRHERRLVALALVAATLLAWGYLLLGAGTGMPAASMSALPTAAGTMPFMAAADWSWGYAALMLLMWWLMMAGMMLPSALPAILLFAALTRSRRDSRAPGWPVAAFCLGYLVVWGGFSLAAVALQWGLDRARLLAPEMLLASAALGAALLIAAGLWQFTAAKAACLSRCRSPAQVLARHWRPGGAGAWRLGLRHGTHCLGCCWVLMLLLFYGGAMNLWWIAGLTLFVLLEKLAPGGRRIGQLAGLLLIAWGAWLACSVA
jgi:predicted metal-binding membrane protein